MFYAKRVDRKTEFEIPPELKKIEDVDTTEESFEFEVETDPTFIEPEEETNILNDVEEEYEEEGFYEFVEDELEASEQPSFGERLTKYLARVGVCSRRQAEEAIKNGNVKVNGKVVKDVGFRVIPGFKIFYNGENVSTDRYLARMLPKLYVYRKPRGVMCTRSDPQNRPTIYDQLKHSQFGHLMYIGRLDFNSEGLLLLTNDGGLARYLSHPSSQIERIYLVRVHGKVTQQHLEKIERGSFIDGVKYGKIEAKIKSQKTRHTWLQVTLYEGKNREIRKVFQHMGMPVSRIIRIKYGPYRLGQLKNNNIREVKITEDLLEHCDTSWMNYGIEIPKTKKEIKKEEFEKKKVLREEIPKFRF